MRKNAPFLKMYTVYISNYNTAMNLINQWKTKSSKFQAIIQDIQKQEECGSIALLEHMLNPIQRIPRYQMLFNDYVKHLPPNSKDSEDASEALNLVTKAANHSNEALKKIEKFRELLNKYQVS